MTTLLTRLVNFGLAFIGNLILARLLGASGMGMWAVMLSFLALIVHLWGPGIAFANVYYVAQRKQTVGESWAATLVLGTGFGLLAMLTGFILVLVRFRSLAAIEDMRLVLLLLFALPLMYISSWGIRIIQGLNRISLMNILDIIAQVVNLIFLVFLVGILKWRLWGAILAYLSWHFTATMAVAFTLLKLMQPGEFRLNWKSVRANLLYGLKMYFGKLSNWANNRVDLLIAPLFLQSAQIGQYAMAVTVTEKLWMFPDAMSQAVLPRISSDAKGRPELTAQACRLGLIIMLPIAILLIATGWWLFPALFGAEFSDSYKLMMAILPGTLAFGLSRLLTTSLAGTNRPATLSGVIAASATVNIVLNFLLIPWLGVIGCSLASTGSYTFEALVLAWFHCRHHQVNPLTLIRVKKDDLRLMLAQGKKALAGL